MAEQRSASFIPYITCLALFETSVGPFQWFYWGHGLVRLGLLGAMLTFVLVVWRAGAMQAGPSVPARPPTGWPTVWAPLPALGLVSIVAILSLSGRFAWGHGLTRIGMVALVGILAVALWHTGNEALGLRKDRVWKRLVAAVLVLLVIQSAHTIAWSMAAASRTDRMRLDEGRTTWRAVQALWRGENPYGSGMLIDSTAFRQRLATREALGVGPRMPAAMVEPALERYLAQPDPRLRRVLVPPPGPEATLAARQEVALLGYKYGPPPLLATAALTPFFGSAAVPLGNGLACLALFAVFGLSLLAAGADAVGAGVAVIALMLDPFIGFYFLTWTATDVWPLMFGFTGLLCAIRGREVGFGVALALAVASKIVPGGLFLLLLPVTRSWRATWTCAVTGAAMFLPFLLWDAWGLLNNFVLWGALMQPATDSWVFGAPADLVLAARIVLAGCMAWVALRVILRRERQICAAFAVITLLLLIGGSAIHNNYVPWFSIWVVLAISETWLIPGAISARLVTARPSAAFARLP